MNICTIYARQDGTIAHVWDSKMDYGTPEANSAIVSQFDIDVYQVEYEAISRQSDAAFLNAGTGDLEINDVVYVDADWIAARLAEVNSAVQHKNEDTSERATLLAQAASALTQIESDKTALVAAGNLAAVKPIVTNMLNREERIIKALRAILRNGLD